MSLPPDYNLNGYAVCDLCGDRFFSRWEDPHGPHYCPMKCHWVPPITQDGVIDTHNVLKRTLTGKGLMVLLKISTEYWV